MLRLPSAPVDLLSPDHLTEHFENQRKPPNAVPTPLAGWNKHCRDEGGAVGLALGWHVIIAGGTGHGKSLLALNLAARAMQQGFGIGFISLEMSNTQLTNRLLAILSGVSVAGLEPGVGHSEDDENAATYAVQELREQWREPFYSTEFPLFDIDDIVAQLEYWHVDKGLKVFVIDYLQLAGSRDAETLFQQVSNVSGAVREFAQRNRVLTVGLSQLNRQASANRQDSPLAQSLMASSSLENDADQVLILDHTRRQRDPLLPHLLRTWLLIAKNRHGGHGEIPVEWNHRTLQIREANQDEEGKWPGLITKST